MLHRGEACPQPGIPPPHRGRFCYRGSVCYRARSPGLLLRRRRSRGPARCVQAQMSSVASALALARERWGLRIALNSTGNGRAEGPTSLSKILISGLFLFFGPQNAACVQHAHPHGTKSATPLSSGNGTSLRKNIRFSSRIFLGPKIWGIGRSNGAA